MKVKTVKEIYLGRIVKAFGIRGELKFNPSDDYWDGVLASKHLVLRSLTDGEVIARPAIFRAWRRHGNTIVVELEGTRDRNTAEAMVGSELFVAGDQIDVDMPDELLPFQLLGMTAKTERGEPLGEISAILRSAAHDIYEITGKSGSFLVPAVPEFIISVDAEDRTMVLRTMPGLVEE
jgi:16S rRNA processing protein RimM